MLFLGSMAAQMVYQNESKVNEGGVVVQEVQPMRDSSGRKVPVWESKQVGSEEDISSPVSQKSWKTWATKAGSWGISKRLSNYPPSPTSPFQQSVFDKNDFWRPISFKAPVLGTLLFVTLALIAILEILAHISSRNNNENGGGLAFAETQEDLPAGILFLYLYLPTIIAVIYSMTWAWIDLDAKRLEPWYQLSKPEGATAQDSLLLQYPFDFLAFVPKKAGQNKYVIVNSVQRRN